MSVRSMIQRATVVALAITCVFALAGCTGASQSAEQGIEVSGKSEFKVIPDKARISASVVTEGKTAQACQDDNAATVKAVIEALGACEVKEESIQTTNAYVSPRYGSKDSDDWVITGYEMTTSLLVSDLDINNVGSIMQACIEAGANQTDGLEYYASGYDEAYAQALDDAIAAARAKAERMAASAGVALGPVVNVQEGYQDTSVRYAQEEAAYDSLASGKEASASATFMPGQTAVTAEVTVRFAIR